MRARLAAERERCGPGSGCSAHSAHYEPFHDTGLRADAIADAVGTRRRSSHFFDAHTALASHEALRARGDHGRARVRGGGRGRRRPRRDADRRAAGERGDGPRRRGRARLERRGAPRRLRGDAARAQRGRADGRARDDRRPGAARRRARARGARRPDAADGDPDAPGARDQRRGGRAAARARRRARAAVADRARRSSSSTACSSRARRGCVEPGPGRRERAPVLAERRALRGAGRALHARPGFSAITHAVGDGAVNGALDAYEAARAAAARHAPRRAHRDAGRRRPAALRRARTSPPRCSRCTWRASTTRTRRARGSTGSRAGALRARLPLRRPRRGGRDAPARLGLDGRRLRPALRHGVGAAAAHARAAPSARRTCRSRRSSARADAARLHDRTPRGSTGDEHVYGRLRAGLRADITAFAQDPVDDRPRRAARTCRCG